MILPVQPPRLSNSPGTAFPPHSQLRASSDAEKAIYHGSKLLDEKLNVARFLLHPEWLDNTLECVRFRVSGMVYKYLRIYEPVFARKGISAKRLGDSWTEVVANPKAVSVIAHTFLDNAAKYSPHSGEVKVTIDDVPSGVYFEVGSYGPRVLPEESERIFAPFYRGKAAQRAVEEGAGYGLYVSQLIASRHLGAEIEFRQSGTNVAKLGHWTAFSITVPHRALIIKNSDSKQ